LEFWHDSKETHFSAALTAGPKNNASDRYYGLAVDFGEPKTPRHGAFGAPESFSARAFRDTELGFSLIWTDGAKGVFEDRL